MFQDLENITFKEFINKFEKFVSDSETIVLRSRVKAHIHNLISKTVSLKEWDEFYDEHWSSLKKRLDIISYRDPEEEEPEDQRVFNTFLVLSLVLIDEEHKHLMMRKGTKVEINKEGFFLQDGITNKQVKKDLFLSTVIFGRNKTEFTPDIPFDSAISSIGNRHFEIFCNLRGLRGPGYYIRCLNTMNPISFSVEHKPFALTKNIVFDIALEHKFCVKDVFPVPTHNTQDWFYLDTNETENEVN
jgi:hypothetical protein